jgi:hypothetical protein
MLIGFQIPNASLLPPSSSPLPYSIHRAIMPRKVATAPEGATDTAEPRRSSRIKDLPKPAPAAKKAAKPRVKKTDKDKEEKAGDKEDKQKPSRGRKRKEADEPNGASAAEDEEPPAKKVWFPIL